MDDERPRDLPRYCDECDAKRQLDFFEEAAKNELRRRFEEGECEWSFDELYSDVSYAMRVGAKTNGRTYPRGCSARLARVIDIARHEERRPERIRLWELEQKAGK